MSDEIYGELVFGIKLNEDNLPNNIIEAYHSEDPYDDTFIEWVEGNIEGKFDGVDVTWYGHSEGVQGAVLCITESSFSKGVALPDESNKDLWISLLEKVCEQVGVKYTTPMWYTVGHYG